jgi:O-antigen ligase
MELIFNRVVKSLIVFFLCLSFFLPIKYNIFYGKSGYLYVFFAIGVCLLWLVLYSKWKKEKTYIDKPLIVLISGFFFLHLILIFWVPGSLFLNVWYFLRFVFGLVVFLFIYFSVEDKDDLIIYLKIIISLVMIQSLLMMVQRYTGEGIGVFQEAWSATEKYIIDGSLVQVIETGGTYANANYLVHWIIYCLFLSLALSFIYKTKITKKIIFLLAFFVFLVALIFSFSRAGWFSIFVGLLFFFVLFIIKPKKVYKSKILLLFLSLLLIFSTILSFTNFTNYFKQKINSSSSYQTRTILNKLGWEMLWDYPYTGVGLDRQPEQTEYYKKYRKEFANAGYNVKELKEIILGVHNTYLLIGIEGGILALALFVAVLVGVLIRNIKIFFHTQDDNYFFLSLAFVGGFLAHFISIYWYVSIKFPFLWSMLWLFIGLGAVNYKLWITERNRSMSA